MYKKQLYFYVVTANSWKIKTISIYNSTERQIPTNKSNEIGENFSISKNNNGEIKEDLNKEV